MQRKKKQLKKRKRKTRKKKSPIDASHGGNHDHFSNARTLVHDDVDHRWIVNQSWMTFTHVGYAFTLKISARVRSAKNDVAHFVTSVRQREDLAVVKPCKTPMSDLREIEKHATFARGFDSGPRFSYERGISCGRLFRRRVARASLPTRDTISFAFLAWLVITSKA